MNVRSLARIAATPIALALVACSAASGEPTSSSAQPVWGVIKPVPINPYPAPPQWPVPDATYCPNVDPQCSVEEETYATQLIPSDALLERLGCTPPLHLSTGTPNGLIAAWYGVCYDTPAVRAELPVVDWTTLCNRCLPLLPAGEVYVVTGPFAVGPNCPSGCPGNGGGNPIGTVGPVNQ